jgi:hypothetical protein
LTHERAQAHMVKMKCGQSPLKNTNDKYQMTSKSEKSKRQNRKRA